MKAASALMKVGVLGGVIGALGIYGVGNTFYNVEPGHRAIVYSRLFKSFKNKIYPEGTHFRIPWYEKPFIYDVRARAHMVENTSVSRDLQMIVEEYCSGIEDGEQMK